MGQWVMGLLGHSKFQAACRVGRLFYDLSKDSPSRLEGAGWFTLAVNLVALTDVFR